MNSFDEILLLVHNIIAAFGVLIIFAGAIITIVQVARSFIYDTKVDLSSIRLNFAKSISLGLELMVGADIIGSLIRPDYYTIGILASIVIIRTIIGYNLERELKNIR